ncbi:MAG TPA: SDR family oxidoreductase, partial [Flavitalea sp.]|nr:SDR family oxidoreductase [Flavitalea sp.]
DVAKKSEVLKFAAWVKKEAGGVDILVNNAGNFNPGEIKDEEEGVLETLIETNLYSAYYLTRALLPLMISKKSGHIFNICSIASLQAYNNGGSYSITKHALAGFSANLRHELRKDNIKVTSVFPGAVNTASWEGSGVAPERLMDADDIAAMIHAASKLSARACVEEMVIRPQLGDI